MGYGRELQQKVIIMVRCGEVGHGMGRFGLVGKLPHTIKKGCGAVGCG